jgi:hypothetical protein
MRRACPQAIRLGFTLSIFVPSPYLSVYFCRCFKIPLLGLTLH